MSDEIMQAVRDFQAALTEPAEEVDVVKLAETDPEAAFDMVLAGHDKTARASGVKYMAKAKKQLGDAFRTLDMMRNQANYFLNDRNRILTEDPTPQQEADVTKAVKLLSDCLAAVDKASGVLHKQQGDIGKNLDKHGILDGWA